MRFTHIIGTVWLAEGHLLRGDRASPRPLIDYVLATSRATGYRQFEGRACWLMAECLATEAPLSAEQHVEAAMRIFEEIGARNDLARAMVTRAGLRQSAGDAAAARHLLDEAFRIFETLGTTDEQARVGQTLAALAEYFLKKLAKEGSVA